MCKKQETPREWAERMNLDLDLFYPDGAKGFEEAIRAERRLKRVK